MAGKAQAAAFGATAFLWVSGASAACSLSDVQWMAGTWQSKDAKTIVEERWTAMPSGQLMGSAWSAHPGAAGGSAEAETILDDGGTITLRLRHFDPTLAYAREDKDAPMVFAASFCELNHVVFDGRGDKIGEHIAYRRSGDSYTFIGDFLPQGKPFHVEQTFAKAQ